MNSLASRRLDQATMLGQVRQVVVRGRPNEPPAFTLILGAGASHGVIPTASEMVGLPDRGTIHAKCVPAFLYEREHGSPVAAKDLTTCVQAFWRDLVQHNGTRCTVSLDQNRFPTGSVPEAYKFLFSQDCVGGLNSPGDARDYLRYVTMGTGGRIRLNGTHFFLGSLLSLQNRVVDGGAASRPFIGRRPFVRTVFTTNFDPLLQEALQLFHNLYYMTDRPELLAADGLHTDDHPALHLFYAHGSVHRPFLANTDDEIRALRDANHRALAPYFATHGVIVLGYSGWDDCLLQALEGTATFRHNLYWLARSEASISSRVGEFLATHPNARWVQIQDGGAFMAELHRVLCPGMPMTELLANPLGPLRERLDQVDLEGIVLNDSPEDHSTTTVGQLAPEGESVPMSRAPRGEFVSPEVLRGQVVTIVRRLELEFADATRDVDLALETLKHRAYMAYLTEHWEDAMVLFGQLIARPGLESDAKAEARLRKARCLYFLNRVPDAVATLDELIDSEPVSGAALAQAFERRAFLLWESDREDDAIEDYSRAIAVPGAEPLHVAQALASRGVLFGNKGLPEKALADFSAALESAELTTELKARARANRAIALTALSRHGEAIEDYGRVIDMPGCPEPILGRALLGRGRGLRRDGRADAAFEDFGRLAALPGAAPENRAAAMLDQARLLQARGDVQGVIANASAVIEINPSDSLTAAALLLRGQIYLDSSRPEDAIADFTRVLALEEISVDQRGAALGSRGIAHGRAKHPDDELADYNAAVELDGLDPEGLCHMLILRGVELSARGQPQAGVEDFTRVIENPLAAKAQVVRALRARALANEKLGRRENAERDYSLLAEIPTSTPM